MQITTFTDNANRALIASLYTAVDNLDAESVGAHLTEDVCFRLGNFETLRGRQAVVDANAAFFGTIAGMTHTITEIGSDGVTVFCTGSVHYTRHDKSELSLPFATVLKLQVGLVSDYRIYVDVSPL
jgi:ketosteroid isomerase-like protein